MRARSARGCPLRARQAWKDIGAGAPTWGRRKGAEREGGGRPGSHDFRGLWGTNYRSSKHDDDTHANKIGIKDADSARKEHFAYNNYDDYDHGNYESLDHHSTGASEGNTSSDSQLERSTGARDVDITPGLGGLLQQLLSTMNQLDARMGQLEAATATDCPAGEAARGNWTTSPPSHLRATPATRSLRARPVAAPRTPDPGDGNDDSGSGSEGSSDSDGTSSVDGGQRAAQGQRRRRPRGRHIHHGRRANIKDLELPTFTPSPKVSVSTWIDRVDLALEGARSSGCGRWSDAELFFILGNKLMDSASRW
ncbi:unnamed protein product [Phytophthora fragariaefolia]|uniref:Unnamed protein product n=1 Tax=Phytophthora fragariaefolia TaxID=1490495 RepID=A0A9W7CW40_9STRA|nr:unnamed protein product [Phytophthora fragariaefolia]